jgi:ribose transport system permease protein
MSMTTEAPTATPAAPARPPAARHALERFGLVFVLIALIAAFSVALPGTFFTSTNLTVTLSGQAAILMLALAVTLPLRAGDFDLSVGMVMIGAGCVLAVLTTRHGMPLLPAALIALGL